MSRKHVHRADNQPVTRRYVRSVVQRARDEIISAIVNSQPEPAPESFVYFTDIPQATPYLTTQSRRRVRCSAWV